MSFKQKFKAGDKVIELRYGFQVAELESNPEGCHPYVLQTKTTTYTDTGHILSCDLEEGSSPSLVLATPENIELINKLFSMNIEDKSKPLTGSRLARRLALKANDSDFVFNAYVSDQSDDVAVDNGVEHAALIVGYDFEDEFYPFISNTGARWGHAVAFNSDLSLMIDDEYEGETDEDSEPLSVGDTIELTQCHPLAAHNVGDRFDVIGYDKRDNTFMTSCHFWVTVTDGQIHLMGHPQELFKKV